MSRLIRTAEVPAADRLGHVREMTAATWVRRARYDVSPFGRGR